MELLIIASVLGCSVALPSRGYTQGNGGHYMFNTHNLNTGVRGGYYGSNSGNVYGPPRNEISPDSGSGGGYGPNPCQQGQVLNENGDCIDAVVTRNVFVYSAPEFPPPVGPPPTTPKPRIDYNIVFVRTPEKNQDLEPIVVPPPQQKTVVYVLTKNDGMAQQVIEVPNQPGQPPEVFYVNYKPGDNPHLAGGLTLQEVLSKQGNPGHVYGAPHQNVNSGVDDSSERLATREGHRVEPIVTYTGPGGSSAGPILEYVPSPPPPSPYHP